jgi:diguanylate cyclase (GGDEF)-like protein
MDASHAMGKGTVLIVEDSATLRQMLGMALESRGYTVEGVGDSVSALRLLSEWLPDAILLDLNLPDIDGFELCKRIRRDAKTRNIPVMVMTSMDQPGFEIMAIEAGADDFIAKPVDPLVLEARLEMVVRRMRKERFENALTGLPGNALTEEHFDFLLGRKKPFAVLFIDIDDFKPFNRRYGFARGDLLLRHVAGIIIEAINFEECEESFVGHLGADDFVVTCDPDHAERVAHDIIDAFDMDVLDFYEDEDRDNGSFVYTDRSGETMNKGPLTMSIGVVPVVDEYPDSMITVSDIGMELRHFAEGLPGSNVIVERRAEPRH